MIRPNGSFSINVKGIECPITWTKGEVIMRHFKGICDPSDITEQIEKY